MKKYSFRFIPVWLLICLSVCSDVYAYNDTGHYYTLLAVIDSGLPSTAPKQTLDEIRIEAFCAELPDLALELDAITQRVRVLESTRDFLWGLRGQCRTKESSHMVALQYYLHGLSGVPAPQLRLAAQDIIREIDGELVNNGLDKSLRRQLICARGFAIHLYGDSFAHVKLESETPRFFSRDYKTEMYDTGLGHARDGHKPDYLYGHNIEINKWPKYVQGISSAIAPDANPKPVLDTHKGCPDGNFQNCDNRDKEVLISIIREKAILMANMQKFLNTGSSGIGDMARATTCDQVVKSAFPDTSNAPDCSKAWGSYLDKAIRVFLKYGIDPTSRVNASADYSCSAWRCAGKVNYNGEANDSSCKIEVTDTLEDGVKEP